MENYGILVDGHHPNYVVISCIPWDDTLVTQGYRLFNKYIPEGTVVVYPTENTPTNEEVIDALKEIGTHGPDEINPHLSGQSITRVISNLVTAVYRLQFSIDSLTSALRKNGNSSGEDMF